MKTTSIYLCIVVVLTGCAIEPDVPPTLRARSELIDEMNAAPSGGEVITFLDSPALQDGTGQMDDDAPEEFTETGSGLKYRVLRDSDGAKPTASNTVKVNYRGWLDDGSTFDGSYGKKPISFSLGGVIAGWTEGLQLVGVGGMIELWIPADLGYGSAGSGRSVPPNATLHFIVELLEVN